MTIAMRCLYIEKKNPVIPIETLEEVFEISELENFDNDGFLYPMDAFDLITSNAWILKSSPTEKDIGKDILCYVFIKKI